MIKIVIAHQYCFDDKLIINLKNNLEEKLETILNLKEDELDLLFDNYTSGYAFQECDEAFLLCSVSTNIDITSLPTNCHCIPITYEEINNQQEISPSLQNINAFLYDKTNDEKSVELLSDVMLKKMGLINNTRKVFISYKRSETSKLAENIRKELLKEGYSVFLDKNNIDFGDDFMQEIRHSLVKSDIFLILNSKGYYDSLYTKKELFAACISGLAIIVLSQDGSNPELNGLTHIHIAGQNKISEEEKKNLITAISNARTKLWHSRHERLSRKLHLLGNCKKFLQGVHSTLHNDFSIYTIVGLPTTLDFQRISQNKNTNNSNRHETANRKVYAFYDNLILPSSYSKHLNWLDKEMPNIHILNTSTFEKQFPEVISNMDSKVPIVFLSASVPNQNDMDYDFLTIHDIVVTLTETIIKTKGTLVFGGHPTITPIIANMMEIVSEEGKKPDFNIYLYQSKFFKEAYPPEVRMFPKSNLKEIEAEIENGEPDRERSLNKMREEMIKSQIFTYAIFIGGRYDVSKGIKESGVWKEFELFKNCHDSARCLYLEKTGIVPMELAKSNIECFKKTTIESLPKELCVFSE